MARTLRTFVSLRRYELHMLMSFLLVITSFWILKPLRKALFVQHYDRVALSLGSWQLPAAQAELCAKLLQVGLAMLAAVAFVRLARSYRRRTLVMIVAGFFVLAFASFAAALGCTSKPGAALIWLLYLAGDLYSTLMVASLFACLNDGATPESARRSYGLVGLGAVLGGVIGSQVVSALLYSLSLGAWLWVCCVLTLAAAWLARTAPESNAYASAPTPPEAAHLAERPRLQTMSPYVISLASLVGLYELISTLLDYQFTATLAHQLDGAAIGRQMGHAFALMNATALVVQLFVTTPLLRRHGAQAALLCLPCTLLCASLGMLVFPLVPMASLVPALDSGFAYSVHQSAKEGLYVPLARDAKYGAKAFVDVFVLRGAKALGVVLSLFVAALTEDASGMRVLSLCTLGLIVPFAASALYAGKRCDSLGNADAALQGEPV